MFDTKYLPEALIGTLLALMMSNSTWAATFNVTSNSCSGTGSIVEAFQQANASPGQDTIEFTAGLTIRVTDGACGVSTNDPSLHFIATVTEDLTINGNGSKLEGDGLWVQQDGRTNTPGVCPNSTVTNNIQRQAPGFVRVDDNVSVTINDLRFQDLYALIIAGQDSTVSLNEVSAVDINDWFGNCDRPPIALSGSSATINIVDSTFGPASNSTTPSGTEDTNVIWPGAFIFGAGNLTIDNTDFGGTDGAVQWSGTANIQSSRLAAAGGVNITSGTANIVNTAILGEASNFDRIRASNGATVNVTASTIAVQFNDCDSQCVGGNGVVQAVGGATVSLSQSAIGYSIVNTNGGTVIRESAGGNVIADAFTWIQPITSQNAADLRTITNQPGLLTDAPGLPTGRFLTVRAAFPLNVTPLLGSPGTPGLLIDMIPDANGANQLLSPIDNSPLTLDALGNPRADGNGTRSIGAVQLTLAPATAVASTTTSGAVVRWTRPKDPSIDKPITGYSVIVEPTDGSAPATRINVSGQNTVSTELTGLMPGTEYRVTVVGVNVDGDGPPSNVVVFSTENQARVLVPVPTIPVPMLLLMAMLLLTLGFRKRSLVPAPRRERIKTRSPASRRQ